MLNNWSGVGRLTKDPELKFTTSNIAVCNFTVAINRPYKNKETNEYEADFIQCQAWKDAAEFLAKYMKKGNLISVTGAINTRTYDNDEGKKVYVTEVNVNEIQSLEKKEASTSTEKIETAESVTKDYNAEWARRSVGLDSKSKKNLKVELNKKYDKLIEQFDLPF